MRTLLLILMVSVTLNGLAQHKRKRTDRKLIFSDNFSEKILSANWAVEKNDSDKNAASIVNNQLQLDTRHGISVWYKKELKGNLLITYDRTVVMEGGPNDRLSDCNQFWMATGFEDERYARKGAFNEYDALRLYYVGFGAHDNSVTRMRRYNGTVNREIIAKDLSDSTFLLQPNRTYQIQIRVENGTSTFIVDGKVFFRVTDKKPYTQGRFAFRSFQSRQRIDNFKIWQLK